LANHIESKQAAAAKKDPTGIGKSADQRSDKYGDNEIGILITQMPQYNGVSCEKACATELGNGDPSKGYKTQDLPEGPNTPREYGPHHPQGTASCKEIEYYSYKLGTNCEMTPKMKAAP
jgi:hypothetical protein